MKKKKYLLYIPLIIIMLIIVSCPEPITEDIVARVEDTGSPTIVVTSPLNNSVYRSAVSFTGKVNDDAANSIENFSFKIQNRPIGGGVIITSGIVSQDSSVGSVPVAYDSSSGNFSFDFSTITPDILKDGLYIDLEAIDWNGNTSTSSIVLYENRDGEYVDITTPVPGSIYNTVLSINATIMDQYVTPPDIPSYENLKEIKYQIIGTSLLQETLTIEGAVSDGAGNINSGGDLTYNTNSGLLTGNISVVSQTGLINFQLTVSDLNGHIESESFNISDGNVSPSVVIDSVNIPEFDGKRYFKDGTQFVVAGHVGPTNRVYDTFNYFADPGTGAISIVDITPSVTNTPEGLKLYEFNRTISASGFQEILQKIKFQFQAEDSAETSTTTVFFTNDFNRPAFDLDANPVTSDATYYYINVPFNESVWGGVNFSSLLTNSDFIVTSSSGAPGINNVDNVTGNLADGQTEVRLRVLKSDPNVMKDGSTIYSINTAGTSGSIGIFDVANNTPNVAGTFTFPDETKPTVDTGTFNPSNGAFVSNDTPATSFDFSENVNGEGGSGDSTGIVKIDGIDYTANISGKTVTIAYGASPLSDGSHTLTIDADAFKDISDNGNNAFTIGWSFTVDPTPPSLGSIEAKVGGVGSDITDTLISAPSNDIVFTIPITDVTTLSKGSGDLIQLIRSVSSDIDINMSSVTLGLSSATVQINKNNFTSNEDFSLKILAGAFSDEASNSSAEKTGNTFTVDAEGPAVGTIEAKINGAGSDITGYTIKPPTEDIEFTIALTESSTPITMGSGNLVQLIRSVSSDIDINMSSVTLGVSSATVIVDKSYFSANENYSLKVLSGAFIDAVLNPSASTTGSVFAVDGIPPALGTITAKINGAGSDITGTIISPPASDITFTIPVNDGTVLTKGSGDLIQLVRSGSTDVNINMSAVNLVGSTATVTIADTRFSSNQTYHLKVLEGAFTDEASNLSPEKTGSIFTVDGTAPVIGIISAEIGGAGGDITGNTITAYPASDIVFTIPITDTSTLSKGSGNLVQLERSSSTDVDIDMSTVNLGVSSATVTISKSYFTSDESYNLKVLDGAFLDAASNPSAEASAGSFRVDTIPYVVASSRSPANGSFISDTSPDIEFDFDENVSDGSSTNKGDVSVGGVYYSTLETLGNITFTLPADTLSDGVTYSVEFEDSAFKDVDGSTDDYCDIYTGSWSFTVDTTPPSVGTISAQLDGGGGTIIGSTISYTLLSYSTIKFTIPVTDATSPISKSTGAKIHLLRNGVIIQDIDLASVSFTAPNATISLLKTDCLPTFNYSLRVDAGAFTDAAGNPSPLITSSTFNVTLP